MLVIHSQQTGALFALPSAEKGHQPRRPLQPISSAQPFFPFGKSSWAFFVSPSKRAQSPKPNHQSPKRRCFAKAGCRRFLHFQKNNRKRREEDDHRSDPKDHDHPLAGYPHSQSLQKLPLPPCGLHLPGPGWRLPADRRGIDGHGTQF